MLGNKTAWILLSTVRALAQLFKWDICVESLAILVQSIHFVAAYFTTSGMCFSSFTQTSNNLIKFTLKGSLRHWPVVNSLETLDIIGWGW